MTSMIPRRLRSPLLIALIALPSAAIIVDQLGNGAAQAAESTNAPGLTRVTTSFDVRHAAAVLKAASRPLSGG